MFGLMELSRQRLRSSLIDKSFEKCNYCKGSGLILNSSSIVDQIIKVIKEKISSNKNSVISVKCNSDLAENLLNIKKNEILSLEKNFDSKINFYFNSQFSLYDPIIDIDESNYLKVESGSKIKKKIIKTTKTTKKKKAIKPKTKKYDKVKNNKDDEEQVELNNNEKKIEEEILDSDIDEIKEKTGWWS